LSFGVCSNKEAGEMRAVVIVIALIVAVGFAYIADIYWCGSAYTRAVVHSLGLVIAVLVNNW
jgi:hypothetical protein